ncbi:MAG: hypothetical protein H0V67_12620 [Geodermatophilaceae bacterium]|nr:hypothetical protein [Geodermatophilaceae bacterium]
MSRKRLLALGAALLLAACGGADRADTDPTAIEVTGSGDEPAAQPTGTESGGTSAAEPSGTTTGSGGGGGDDDDQHDVEVSDQSGDGSSVVVDRVRVEAAGFVVIVDNAGRVVGNVAVEAGESTQLSIPTDISESGDFEALLYADDGDGRFDPATDLPVPDDDDDGDDDGDDDDDDSDDLESDDFDYELA